MSEDRKEPGRKHDWDAIEREYVEGADNAGGRFPTYEELAETCGVLATNLRSRGAKDHWAQKREVFKKKISDARQEKMAEAISEVAARMEQRNLKSLDAISIMIHNKIAVAVRETQTLSNLAMKEFTTIIEDCTRIAARILGEDKTEREFVQSGAYGGRALPTAEWTVTNGREVIDAFILPSPDKEKVNGSGGTSELQ
jgi:hypothetical protein